MLKASQTPIMIIELESIIVDREGAPFAQCYGLQYTAVGVLTFSDAVR